MKKIIYLLSFMLVLIGCQEVIKEIPKEVVKITEPQVQLSGKYYSLKSQPIKIFLPNAFVALERHDVLKIAQNLDDEYSKEKRVSQIEFLIQSKIPSYYYHAPELGAFLSIYLEDNVQLDKQTASYFLGVIQKKHEEVYFNQRVLYTKIDSRFKSNDQIKIVKSIYEVTHAENKDFLSYYHLYLINYKNKLYFFELETPELIDYEPYVLKTTVL